MLGAVSTVERAVQPPGPVIVEEMVVPIGGIRTKRKPAVGGEFHGNCHDSTAPRERLVW